MMTKDMGWKHKEEGRKEEEIAAMAEDRIDSQVCDHSYSRS